MVIPPKITFEQVLAFEKTLPIEIQNAVGDRNLTCAIFVIRNFLGGDWVRDHILIGASDYLALQDTDGVFEFKAIRVIEFGELLLNLQNLHGFDAYIQRLKPLRDTESSVAELHIAKMLWINDWDVRLVDPSGVEGGDNFDLEWPMNDCIVAADTKCKIDGEKINGKAITGTLIKYRGQLPADRPGIFFIKIPQQWLEVEDHATITGQAAMDFFNTNTQRVVSVVYYSEPISYNAGTIRQDHRFKEVQNPKVTRFGKGKDWRVFQKWWPTSKDQAMPPKWIRLLRPGPSP